MTSTVMAAQSALDSAGFNYVMGTFAIACLLIVALALTAMWMDRDR
jgi:hypothetical protein